MNVTPKNSHWIAIQHSWAHIGIYTDGRHVAALDISEDATEDNQDEMEARMEEDAAFIVKAVNAHDKLVEALRNLEVAANSLQYCYDRMPQNFAAALTQLHADAQSARVALAEAGEQV